MSPQRTATRSGCSGRKKPDAASFLQGRLCECRYFCRLFDIVGLDEGTCGRRLAVSRVLKALDNRLKLSRSGFPSKYYFEGGLSYVLHVSIRKEYCAERLLEMSCRVVEFHCDVMVT